MELRGAAVFLGDSVLYFGYEAVRVPHGSWWQLNRASEVVALACRQKVSFNPRVLEVIIDVHVSIEHLAVLRVLGWQLRTSRVVRRSE